VHVIGGVRVKVESDELSGAKMCWMLKAYWKPPGLVERQLILDTSESGLQISYKLGAVDAMLRHAHKQGASTRCAGF